MISFFPDIYPDELIYSTLARYYIKSGYTAYIFAALPPGTDWASPHWLPIISLPQKICMRKEP